MFERNGFERALGFALLSLLIAEPCVSNAQSTEPPLRATLSGVFQESVQDEVRVSGSVIVGVATASALSGTAALAGLRVPDTSRDVCLAVISRDGVYSSQNTFQMPGLSNGRLVILPFDGTKRPELVKSYAENDLAVRAMPGNCNSKGNEYLVVRPDDGRVAFVNVLVNSLGANYVFFQDAVGNEVSCNAYTEGRTTSYDFFCRVPIAGDGRQEITIERERYGRRLPKASLTLVLTDASA